MTGSPIFSVNFADRNNPAKPNYHTHVCGLRNSQAKCTENIGLPVI